MDKNEFMKKMGMGTESAWPPSSADMGPGGAYDQNTEAGKLAYALREIKQVREVDKNEAQAEILEQGLPMAVQPDAALDRGFLANEKDIADWEAVQKQFPNISYASILDIKRGFRAQYITEYTRRGRSTPSTSGIVGKDFGDAGNTGFVPGSGPRK